MTLQAPPLAPERTHRDKDVGVAGAITGHLGKPQIIAGKPDSNPEMKEGQQAKVRRSY